LEDGDGFREPTLLPALQYRNHSQTPLLNDDSVENRYVRTDIVTDGENSNSVGGVVEATRSVDQKHSMTLNVHGFEQFGFFGYNPVFSQCVSFLFPVFFFNILYYKNSSWDLIYLYVSNLSKIFTEVIIPSLN
jgi:hypothetical protein